MSPEHAIRHGATEIAAASASEWTGESTRGRSQPPGQHGRGIAASRSRHGDERRPYQNEGSVLIIVIWVCLGLVALTLYFANSMSSELRAADNRTAATEAQQVAAAGTR